MWDLKQSMFEIISYNFDFDSRFLGRIDASYTVKLLHCADVSWSVCWDVFIGSRHANFDEKLFVNVKRHFGWR